MISKWRPPTRRYVRFKIHSFHACNGPSIKFCVQSLNIIMSCSEIRKCIMQESSGDENEDNGLMEASKVQRKPDSLPRSRAAVCEQVPGLPDPDTLLKRQSHQLKH